MIFSTEATTILPPAAAAQTQPDPFAAPRPLVSPSAAPARPRSARPGVPLPLALGAAAALLALVALGAWALRPRAATDAATTPATMPPVTEPAKPVVPTETSAAATGSLRVVSEPAGARVTINGESRGRTPLELGELAFGRYDVRVEQAGFERRRAAVELQRGRARGRAARHAQAARRADHGLGRRGLDPAGRGRQRRRQGRSARRRSRGSSCRPGKRRSRSRSPATRPGRARSTSSAGRERARRREAPASSAAPPPTPEPVDVARVYPNEAGRGGHAGAQALGRVAVLPVRAARRG